MKKKLICAVAATCVAFALFASGCAAEATSQTLRTSDETNAEGNTIGAYKTGTELSYTSNNDEYDYRYLSDAEIDDVYTFTLEGTQYTLPFDAQKLVDSGWSCNEELVIPAQWYMSPASEVQFTYKGDNTKTVYLQFLNDTDEAKDWKDCKVVGITVRGVDTSTYKTTTQITTSKGITLGSKMSDIQEAYGASDNDPDRFGCIGYNWMQRNDPTLQGNRWYGQQADSLVFTVDSISFFPNWDHEDVVYQIHMDYFKDIAASE